MPAKTGREPSAAEKRKPAAPAEVPKPELAATGPVITAEFTRFGGTTKLSNPRSVAVDSGGHVYVIDYDSHRVLKLDAAGKEMGSIAKKGTGPGEFQDIWIVGTDGQSQVYLLDPRTGFINIYGSDGKYVKRVGGDVGFYSPAGMAVGKDGTIIVADTGGSRIVRLGSDGKVLGKPITEAGGARISQPCDVSVDGSGNFHVQVPTGGDKGVGSLLNFAADGTFKSRWSTSLVPSTVDTPRTVVAVDGRIYLADVAHGRILVYSADGKTVSPVKIKGLDAPFLKIGGMALDKEGRLYVSDAVAHAIYRLEIGASSKGTS